MYDAVDTKRRDREIWAAGDYDAIAELIWDVGEQIVGRAGVSGADDALDVACGTGNAAIRAAAAGARTVGLDLTPELLAAGRRRAREAGVELEWLEGDAESLPFDDDSFDVVLSVFGCMFAPSHERTAGELARVLRPGGRIGLCCWTPDGVVGDFFRIVASHLPAPAEPATPPALWGTEEHVRALLGREGMSLQFDRDQVAFRFDSAPEFVDMYAQKFGPVLMARRALEPEGRWPALRDDLIELFETVNTASHGLEWHGEYLVVLGKLLAPGS